MNEEQQTQPVPVVPQSKEIRQTMEFTTFYHLVAEFIQQLNQKLDIPPERQNTAIIAVGIFGSEHYDLGDNRIGYETDGNYLLAIRAENGRVSIKIFSPFNRDMTATVKSDEGIPYPKVKQLFGREGGGRYREELSYVAGQPVAGLLLLPKNALGQLGEIAFPNQGWKINVKQPFTTTNGMSFNQGTQIMDAQTFTHYIAARKGVIWTTEKGEVLTQTDAREAKAQSALRDIIRQLLTHPQALAHILTEGWQITQMNLRLHQALETTIQHMAAHTLIQLAYLLGNHPDTITIEVSSWIQEGLAYQSVNDSRFLGYANVPQGVSPDDVNQPDVYYQQYRQAFDAFLVGR